MNATRAAWRAPGVPSVRVGPSELVLAVRPWRARRRSEAAVGVGHSTDKFGKLGKWATTGNPDRQGSVGQVGNDEKKCSTKPISTS